jgi:predicted Fe-S protein YdhL (DUF1289 family)
MKTVKTPCIGICSTTSFGDKICRGCKRFNFEVIGWNGFTHEQKLAVQARINLFTEQLMSNKFIIQDYYKLQTVLQDFRVYYDPDLSPYFWLHQLLQKHLHRLQSISEAGVSVQPPYAGQDVRDMLLQINDELHTLSEAHYDRYFR